MVCRYIVRLPAIRPAIITVSSIICPPQNHRMQSYRRSRTLKSALLGGFERALRFVHCAIALVLFHSLQLLSAL